MSTLMLTSLLFGHSFAGDSHLDQEVKDSGFGLQYCLSSYEVERTASFIEPKSGRCMVGGLPQVSCEGRWLTIKQQLCSGWNYVFEEFRFRYDEVRRDYYLETYSRSVVHRNALQQDLTRAEFGKDQFGDVSYFDLDRQLLIELLNRRVTHD